MQKKLVKQFGLQRSGTNALRALMELNFKDCVVVSNYLVNKHNAFSWKLLESLSENSNLEHGDRATEIAATVLTPEVKESFKRGVENRSLFFAICIKDPASWMSSYYGYRNLKATRNNPSKDFPFSSAFAKRALLKWEEQVSSWMEFVSQNPDHCEVVVHESLIADPFLALQKIAKKFDFQLPDTPNLLMEGYAKRGNEKLIGNELINRKKSFDRSYHLKDRWLEKFPSDFCHLAIESFAKVAAEHSVIGEHISELDLKQRLGV